MSKPKFTAGYKAAIVLVESLLALMEERGVNRADLARRANVSRSTVTKWLTPGRNLTVFTAVMIADELGADIEVTTKPREPAAHINEFIFRTCEGQAAQPDLRLVAGYDNGPTSETGLTPRPTK